MGAHIQGGEIHLGIVCTALGGDPEENRVLETRPQIENAG